MSDNGYEVLACPAGTFFASGVRSRGDKSPDTTSRPHFCAMFTIGG
jgi:hypothetical protein